MPKKGHAEERIVAVLLRREGWHVNPKCIYRLYREEESIANQCWSMDFVSDEFANGRSFRILTVIDQFTRKCVALEADRSMETLYIEPGSQSENGYCQSFNGKLRDECLNGEIFYSLREAQVVIEKWRVEYNTRRPHSALGQRPPVASGL